MATKAKRGQEQDHVDRWLDKVKDDLPPELDLTVEGIVDRINGIRWRLQKMLDETLEELDLSHGEWKVLSSLRWAGKPYRRSAGELARMADLSTGAMTNRLDQLEGAGLVRRLRDPDDRRSVLVELTAQGRRKHEAAIGVQLQKEALIGEALTKTEREQLNTLLRRVMVTLEEHVPK